MILEIMENGKPKITQSSSVPVTINNRDHSRNSECITTTLLCGSLLASSIVLLSYIVMDSINIQNSYEWTPVSCYITEVHNDIIVAKTSEWYELYVSVDYNYNKSSSNHKVCEDVYCTNYNQDERDRYYFNSIYRKGEIITCFLDIKTDLMKLSEDASDFPNTIISIVLSSVLVLLILILNIYCIFS